MASLSRFDSTIARFDAPPMTRAWPGSEGLQALFEACVQELLQICRRDPCAWLSDADLASILYTILAQQLPAHGLSPRCLHAGIEIPAKPRPEAKGRPRRIRVDLALLHPDMLRVDESGAWEGSVELFAATRRGCRDVEGLGALLEGLAAAARANPQAACYLVAVGYGESRKDRDEIARLALQTGVPLLGEIIDSPDDRQNQPSLL